MASFTTEYKHSTLEEVRESIELVTKDKRMFWLRSALALFWLRGIQSDLLDKERIRKGRQHQDEEPRF